MPGEYFAEVAWKRDGETFTDLRYSRAHVWRFDGVEVPASSSPLGVKPPYSKVDAVDPEEALVASLSSCHMLFFLYFAAKRGFVVNAYRDRAVGLLGRNEAGRIAMLEVKLRPEIAFGAPSAPDAETLAALHHEAHEACYIANSVTARITVEPAPEAGQTIREMTH